VCVRPKRSSGHGRPEPLDEPARERVGAGDAHLLAQDRADSGLVRIPCPRHAQAGPLPEQRADDRIVGEPLGRLLHVGVEVGDPARAADDVHQLVPVREVDAQQQVVIPTRQELEHTRLAAGDDGAPVDLARDALDPGDGARLEVAGQRAPVEHPVVRQAQAEAVLSDQAVAPPAAGPQLPRGHPENVAARAVELAHAPEPGREGDLAHAQVGLVQEPAREVGARGASEAVGRHAEMRGEEPAQVACGHAEPGA